MTGREAFGTLTEQTEHSRTVCNHDLPAPFRGFKSHRTDLDCVKCGSNQEQIARGQHRVLIGVRVFV